MKDERKKRIIELIKESDIETQEELLEKLNSEGFLATQSTISRDIKELKLTKTLSPGGKYKYTAIAGSGENQKGEAKYRNILKETVISIVQAKNLAVVKTYPGMAPAAGAAIDAMEITQIVGSVAGDDTLLLIFLSDEDCCSVTENLGMINKG